MREKVERRLNGELVRKDKDEDINIDDLVVKRPKRKKNGHKVIRRSA
jgi:hypothetical protein